MLGLLFWLEPQRLLLPESGVIALIPSKVLSRLSCFIQLTMFESSAPLGPRFGTSKDRVFLEE